VLNKNNQLMQANFSAQLAQVMARTGGEGGEGGSYRPLSLPPPTANDRPVFTPKTRQLLNRLQEEKRKKRLPLRKVIKKITKKRKIGQRVTPKVYGGTLKKDK